MVGHSVMTFLAVLFLTLVGANPLPTLSKSSALPLHSKVTAIPTVSYSQSYTPVQKTRAVTSYKPVVSYKPVTEYQTAIQYQPTLTKHHSVSAQPAQLSHVASSKGHRVLYGKSSPPMQPAAVVVPTVSYSKSYRPVHSTRAVTSLKPVVSYKPVTEYQTVTQYQPTLSKHHTTATTSAYVTSGKGRRVLYGKSSSQVQPVKVAIPTVSYSKSYRPVQSTRAVTSLKPVVSYKPVTEYQTVTQYQPTLSKHHTTTSLGKHRRQLGDAEDSQSTSEVNETEGEADGETSEYHGEESVSGSQQGDAALETEESEEQSSDFQAHEELDAQSTADTQQDE